MYTKDKWHFSIFLLVETWHSAQDDMVKIAEFALLLLARLINHQDEVYRGFGRRSP